MGRLHRKKTSRKKKKESENPSAESQIKDDADEKKPVLSADTSGDIAKRQALTQKKQPLVIRAAASKPEKGFLDKAFQFLREVKIELKKVTWPTRKQTIGSTAVVIILVLIISLFLGIVDIGLSSLVRVVLQ